jgi:hypothetical protein
MSALKHKGKGPQVLTANGLKTGPVVYLDADFNWTTLFVNALRTEDPDIIDKMQSFGEKAEANNIVLGVYFIDISPATGLPSRYREKFRANGPSYDPGNPTHAAKASAGAIILGV